MNLIMNSIDAMKVVDGTRELIIKSERGEDEQVLVSISDTGVGLLRSRRTRSSRRSLPPNLMAPAWDFGSAAPSSNRTVAAYGPPTTLRAAQVFISPYPANPRRRNERRRRSRIEKILGDEAVRRKKLAELA